MENYEIIWERALKQLKVSVSTIAYATYIEQLKPIDIVGSKLILSTKSELFASEVAKRLIDKIREALAMSGSGVTDIKLYVEGSNEDYLARKGVALPDSEIDSTPINPKYTFDTFVVGPSNRYLYAAAKAVAENPSDSYNPLFIYGGAGLGKTHIMHAIANYIKQNNPLKNVLYATCEKFTSDLITTIRQGKAYSQEGMDFRNKYRNVDVLIIDDVQFLAKKQSTQEEFFHTFNELHMAKKAIIISSDKPPKDMETLEERIRSRFEWGLITDIGSPDYETRMAILRRKKDMDDFELDDEILDYIATNIKSNIRELEGALNKLLAYSNLEHKQITMEVAIEELQNIISPDKPKEITPQLIIDVVCEHFGITLDQIKSKSRSNDIAKPRQIAMYLSKNMTDASLDSIGSLLGGRDHSTIIHGINKITDEYESNENIHNSIDTIKKKINPN